jgi:pilus assembly protein Flp/PilA
MRRLVPNCKIRSFLPAQEGTTAIEYALIAAGIAGVLVAVITQLGGQMTAMWGLIASMFS